MPKNDTPTEIYMESSPNPDSMKFVADRMLVDAGLHYDFTPAEGGKGSPLAEALFGFAFIQRVFVMSNFITITKAKDTKWEEIGAELRAFIKSHLDSGEAVVVPSGLGEVDTALGEDKMASRVQHILDEYVKPAVERDGGAISFDSYAEGVVRVRLQGACSGCPSSTITLKMGIENLLRNMIPEVKAVEAIAG